MTMTVPLAPIEVPPTPPSHRSALGVGVVAAMAAMFGVLAVLASIGLIGWFVTDEGTHGTPRGGLRMAAVAWLAGHGSGVVIEGVSVTAWPLGITGAIGWTLWRLGLRAGHAISGVGPSRVRLADGGRDWTVATTVLAFAATYLAGIGLMSRLVGDATLGSGHVLPRAALFLLVVMVPAVAIGSGRAATWADHVPAGLVVSVRGAYLIVRDLLVCAALLVLGALILDFSIALNIVDQLGADTPESLWYGVANLAAVPNAIGWALAYLLGPGFSVGVGTVVSTHTVVLGPLPLVPLLAALPDQGSPAGWVQWLFVLPVLIVAAAVVRNHRRYPSGSVGTAALRGVGAGVLAALVLTLITWLSGGAVGPGRLEHVGPWLEQTLTAALSSLGLAGGISAVAWQLWLTYRDREQVTDSSEQDL